MALSTSFTDLRLTCSSENIHKEPRDLIKDKAAAAASTKPKGRWTRPLLLVSFATAFGSSFPHGWNTGVLNAPQDLIISFLNQSFNDNFGSLTESDLNWLWSFTVAIYLFCGMIGAFTCSFFSEKFGRRNSILILHGAIFLAAVFMGVAKLANSFILLLLGRAIVGYGCGANTALVPMYLTEIAPTNLRGALGTVHQLFMTLGILAAQIFGMSDILGRDNLWPWLLGSTAVPGLVSLCILPWYPDSPRFLLINKKSDDKAREALTIFRGDDDVTDDLHELRMEYRMHQLDPDWGFCRLLKARYLAWPIALVCSISLVQQLSGINVVFFYSNSIFMDAGVPSEGVQYATVGTGLINFLMTIVSVWAVERFGRRSLLLLGMIIMLVTMIILTVCLNMGDQGPWPLISIICVLVYIIGFALGLGPIPQFIGAELFQQGPRPPAMAFAAMMNWMANFLVGLLFPHLEAVLKAFSFLPFVVIVICFFILIYIKLPETKNRTYEDIAREFSIKEKSHEKENGMDQVAMCGNGLPLDVQSV